MPFFACPRGLSVLRLASLLATLVALVAVSVALPAAAQARTFVVDDAANGEDSDTTDSRCETSEHTCTLRAAIQQANREDDRDTITFDLPDDAVIRPETRGLDTIRKPLTIDGTGDDGRPGVEIDGSLLPVPSAQSGDGWFVVRPHGLYVANTQDVAIRGMIINHTTGAAIAVTGSTDVRLEHNWLGLDRTGTQDAGYFLPINVDTVGVLVEGGSARVTIGGPLAGQGNVISGNERGVVAVDGALQTSIEGNLFGLSADGREPVRNDRSAIEVAHGYVGDAPRETEIINNVVSSTGRPALPELAGEGDGIHIYGAVDTTIAGNWVGYDRTHEHVAGTQGGTLGIDGTGIRIDGGRRTTIGGRGAQANHVAASTEDAILVAGKNLDGTRVQGNVVGLNAEGSDTVDAELEDTTNAGNGIRIVADDAARDVLVGGDGLGEGNTVAGSRKQYGILVEGPLVSPRIAGNTVGTSVVEPFPVPDKLGGIFVDSSAAGRPSAPMIVGNRVVAEPVGIRVERADAARVRGNRIGLSADGAVIGTGYGVAILDAPGAEVGGSSPEDANTIVGSRQAGVMVNDARAAGTRIFNNDIGRTTLPTTATPDELGNKIGVAVGEAAGRQAPIDVTVGGATLATANRIANGGVGVVVRGQARRTTVAGNVLGLDGDEPASLVTGIEVSRGPDTQVGLPGRPNVVVGATSDAIRITGAATGRRVQGNRLGLRPAPSTAVLGNDGNAIRLQGASDVVVGYGLDDEVAPGCADTACNEIADSGSASIAVVGEGVHNTIRGNRVRESVDLAVDLGGSSEADGLDRLDARDADGGANRKMNAPTGVQVVRSGRQGSMLVTGIVESATPRDVTIDVYRQPMPADRSGIGEDTTYVATVRPDAHGSFVAPADAGHTGKNIMYTAVATDADGNSSEFAQACGAQDATLGSDSDEDGICDEWEQWGVDVDLDGVEDFDFPDARTKQRDAYLEVDAMEGPNLRPSRTALTRVQRALSEGPNNGVVLHFVTGDGDRDHVDEDVPAAPGPLAVSFRKSGALDDYDDYRWGHGSAPTEDCPGYFGTAADRKNTDRKCWARMAARGLVVRYVLAAEELVYAGSDGGKTLGQAAYGRGFTEAIGGQTASWAFANALGREGCGSGSTCRELVRSWTFMHELGHTFGLHHSGDNDDPVYDPAHLSVMSYTYAMPKLELPLDYGRGDGPAVVDERHVDEQHGFTVPASATARGWKVAVSTLTDPFLRGDPRDYTCDIVLLGAGQGNDFDLDGTQDVDIPHGLNDPSPDDSCLDADKQTDRSTGDYDEWGHLELSVLLADRSWRPSGLRAGAGPQPEPEPAHRPLRVDLDGDGISVDDVCPTVADRDQADADHDGIGDACTKPEILGASDLAVKVDGPSRLRAGERGELTLTLTNDWPIAAGEATVALTLPAGLVVDGTPEGDGDWDATTARWTVDGVGVRGQRRLVVPVRADAVGGTAVDREVFAEVAAAADEDVDSRAGNDVPGEDDWAAHPIELLPGDAVQRQLSVADTATAEGTKVARRLRFVITLDHASVGTVRLRARTRPDSATTPEDFDAVDVPVRFAPDEVRKVVEVPVRQDAQQEDDEDLTLELTGVEGAGIARGTARGTIRDDDQPLGAGDLTALTCIGPYSDTKACGIEGPGLRGAKLALMVGGRDLYVSDQEQLLLLHRDPATEAIEPVRCWAVFVKERECERLQMAPEEGEEGGPVLRDAETRRMAASADGRLIAMSSSHAGHTGEDPRVQLLIRDPATGDLRYTGCVVPKSAVGCRYAVVGLPDDVHVSPDGRFVYLVSGFRVRRIAVSEDGVPTEVTLQRFDDSEPGHEPNQGDSTSALAPDGRTLLVRTKDRLTVLDRDPVSGAVSIARSIDLPGFGPVAIAPDGSRAYAFSHEQRLLRQYGYPDLADQGCVQERGTAHDAGCAARPALLRGIGELAPTADGRNVYGSVSGGGAIVVHRDGDGRLKSGRCIDPEDAVDSCDESGESGEFGGGTVLATADGRIVFTLDGHVANQLVRIQPPAPDGNRAPVCAPANVRGRPNSPMRVPLRCADFDGDAVTVRLTSDPAHGTFDPFDADTGTATYHPELGFRGADSATFRGSDGRAESAETRIDVSVGNHAPMCASTSQFAHSTRGATGLWVSCVDDDGDPLTVTVVEGPQHGTLGAFDGLRAPYTPQPGYRGPDQITVRASDPYDAAEPVTISLDVGDPAPSCQAVAPMTLSAKETAKASVSCSDPDGGSVALSLESGVSFATAALKDGTVTVTASETAGSGKLVVAARDDGGQVARVEIPVTVTVAPPPEPKAPTCSNNCQPDAGGTITITYLCQGKSVSRAKYNACKGQAVMIVCSSPSACRTVTGGIATARRKGKAKVKILPGVKGKRLAQVQTSVKPGKTGRLKLKLTKAGRKELARKRKMRVAIVIDIRQVDGRTSRVRKVITIRAPKKAARKPAKRRR